MRRTNLKDLKWLNSDISRQSWRDKTLVNKFAAQCKTKVVYKVGFHAHWVSRGRIWRQFWPRAKPSVPFKSQHIFQVSPVASMKLNSIRSKTRRNAADKTWVFKLKFCLRQYFSNNKACDWCVENCCFENCDLVLLKARLQNRHWSYECNWGRNQRSLHQSGLKLSAH